LDSLVRRPHGRWSRAQTPPPAVIGYLSSKGEAAKAGITTAIRDGPRLALMGRVRGGRLLEPLEMVAGRATVDVVRGTGGVQAEARSE
jgi:hypothetical protein